MIVTLEDGQSFRLLSPDKLTLATKIRIQQETGYGPVKLAAAISAMDAMREVFNVPEGGRVDPEALAKLAEDGDVDLVALGCLFWGSRIQCGEPDITFREACNFADGAATYQLEPDEIRAAEEAAKKAGPTRAVSAHKNGGGRPVEHSKPRPK